MSEYGKGAVFGESRADDFFKLMAKLTYSTIEFEYPRSWNVTNQFLLIFTIINLLLI